MMTATAPTTARETVLLALGDAWEAADAAGLDELALDIEADTQEARTDPELAPPRPGVPAGLELWGADVVRRLAAALRGGDAAEARRQAALLEVAFGTEGARSGHAAAVARHGHRLVRRTATGWPPPDQAAAAEALRTLRGAAGG
ncbi:hypothetical protein CR162_14910 [Pseudoroseomonas rhizosphaerae]|uniref:Uncharacterized protein n=1 Tax=Teichococcus rhizosphaerae TaxID=1335062 RepID=A0A2C7A1X9_9PROT|nr:hypothetical protein [Pseudoroseomonas rhizosphaerae]PHK94058.1 hypothetical protein CR162_14910 [Pseudoroseomonas rhizosphaerae]